MVKHTIIKQFEMHSDAKDFTGQEKFYNKPLHAWNLGLRNEIIWCLLQFKWGTSTTGHNKQRQTGHKEFPEHP